MTGFTERIYGPGRIEPRDVTHCDSCLGMRWLDEQGHRHIKNTDCSDCVEFLTRGEVGV